MKPTKQEGLPEPNEELWDWCCTEVLKLDNGQDVWKQIQRCKDARVAQAQQEAVEETLKKVEKIMSGKGYITYEDLEVLKKEQE